jgi:sRNA-binding regulator protein Hfq
MKESLDTSVPPEAATAPKKSATAEDAVDPRVSFANRKLIRPVLNVRVEHADRVRSSVSGKKVAPPEQTSAEAFYYQKQMQSRTPVTVVLHDGEELNGVIEWYDKDCIKLNRNSRLPNLLIYKASIKYLYKQQESNGKSR